MQRILLDDAIAALHSQPKPLITCENSETGEITAYIVRPEAVPEYLKKYVTARSKDPRQLPRSVRPKQKLSKRQRDNAKREKLNPPVPA